MKFLNFILFLFFAFSANIFWLSVFCICLPPSFAAVAVSRDHKPDQTDERQRIEDAGGFVMWAGSNIINLDYPDWSSQ